jgi:hypothetical protein
MLRNGPSMPQEAPLPNHPTTPLASSQVNHDELRIELVEPPDRPPMVAITWPTKPSVTTPDGYSNVAATCMQVLSAAVIESAAIRRRRRL